MRKIEITISLFAYAGAAFLLLLAGWKIAIGAFLLLFAHNLAEHSRADL